MKHHLLHLQKAIIALVLSSIPFTINSSLRIIFINTPSITIGGKKLHVDDSFSEDAKIIWDNPRQAMKVVDSATGRQRLLTASQLKKNGANTVKDFLKGKKHLATRAGASIPDLRASLSSEFILLDSIRIDTSVPIDENRFFFISFPFNGESINKRIENHPGFFLITRDIFKIDGNPIDPFDTDITVYYMDKNDGNMTVVTESMHLDIVPLKLEEE